MTHRTPLHIGTAVLLAAIARPAAAAPFDARAVPADARWVVHVDADAGRDTAVGRALREQLTAAADVKAKLAQVTAATGVHVERDLHDVTLFGSGPGDESVVVVVRSANLDRRRMTDIVAVLPGYAAHEVAGRSLVQWTQDGRVLHGGFHGESAVVLGRSEAKVAAALDALDGKGTAPADGPLAGRAEAATRPAVAAGERPMLYVAATDLPGLAAGVEVPGPLKQVEGVHLAVVESGANLLVRADVTATSAEEAEQLRTAAEGLKAMAAFAAMGADADPKAKAASAAMQRAVVGRGGRTVTIDFSMPSAQVVVAVRSGKMTLGLDDDGHGTTRPSASVSVKVDVDNSAK